MRRLWKLIQKAKNEVPPILRLNDDCLAHIFSFLTLKERIKLARVCKKWKAFVELWPWYDIKELKISFEVEDHVHKTKYTLPILEQVLGYCGKFITSLRLGVLQERSFNEAVMMFIVESCPNLKSLDMLDMELSSSVAEILAESYSNLVNIAIGNCRRSCTEAISKLLSNNQQLKAVKFKGDIELDGSCLLQLPGESIESLSFRSSSTFPGIDVIKVFENMKKLKTLVIGDVPGLSLNLNELLGVLPNKLKLEDLSVYQDRDTSPIELIPIRNICHFTNLRKLTLMDDSLNDELATVIGKNCKHLSYVGLYDMYALTDLGLKNLLDKSQIQELYLNGLFEIPETLFAHISLPSLKILQCYQLDEGWTNKSLRLCMIASPNLSRLKVDFLREVDVDTLIEDALHYSSNRSCEDVLNLIIPYSKERRIISSRLIVTDNRLLA